MNETMNTARRRSLILAFSLLMLQWTGLPTLFFLPVPLLAIFRDPDPMIRRSLSVLILSAGILVAPDRDMMFAVLILFGGSWLMLQMRKHGYGAPMIILASSGVLLFLLCLPVLYRYGWDGDAWMRDVFGSIEATLEQSRDILGSVAVLSPEEYRSTMEDLRSSAPAIMLSFTVLFQTLNFYIANWWLIRCHLAKEQVQYRLDNFAMPSGVFLYILLFWVMLRVLASNGYPYAQSLQLNGSFFFFVLFYIQGISVFAYFVRNKLKTAGRNILILLISLFTPLMSLLSLLGMVDSILPIRR